MTTGYICPKCGDWTYINVCTRCGTRVRSEEAGGHPEDFCQRCGRPNVTWFAPNELWNQAVPDGGILCPVCFVKAAEASGLVPIAWCVVPERREKGADRVGAAAEPTEARLLDLFAQAACAAKLEGNEEGAVLQGVRAVAAALRQKEPISAEEQERVDQIIEDRESAGL